MTMNQVIIEGTLRKGSDIYPNKQELSETVFIEYEEYEVEDSTWLTLLQSDDVMMNLLNNHIGEKILVTGRLDGTAVRVQDFSCLK